MTNSDAPPPTTGPGQVAGQSHGHRTPRPRLRRRLLIGTGVLVVVIALAAGGAVWKLQANITSVALPDSKVTTRTPSGAMNILFLGSDSRDLRNKKSGYGKADGTRRSDAMLLVHIASGNKRIDAVQIPRDTVMELPACKDTGSGSFPGGYGQINSALNFGPGCSVTTIEKLSGVRVDHFVELDFEGFAKMVNALDGVPVCLATPLKDVDAKLDLPAGKLTLGGKDALALARTRHAIGDGSDIGRLSHQQMVMSAIVDRARSAHVLTRPDRLFSFLNALTKSITVDEGISSIPALSGLAKRAQAVPSSKITFITMPWAAAPTDPNRVVPTDDATTVFTALAKDNAVPLASDSTKDSATRSAPVRILNAARVSGLATSAQASLATLGYTVSGLADSEKPATTTRLFVGSTPEDRKTAESLNDDLGLGAKIVQQDITGVWLILGSDRIKAGTDLVKPEPVKATTRTADASLCS